MKNNEDIETTEVDDETAAAEKVLTDAGDEAGVWKLRAERAQRALAKEKQKSKQAELEKVRTALATEFEYADPELIVGKTESEMRASAERAHKNVEKVIASKGLIKADLTPAQIAAAEAAKLKTDWGAAPAIANEAVSGDAPMDYAELGANARSGKMTRSEVLADIGNHGPRRITRPTIASAAIRGRGEPAKTA